jgi:ribosome biogenesis protein SSF1/2
LIYNRDAESWRKKSKCGLTQKKARSNNVIEDELEKDLPKTFVVRKGEIPRELQEVLMDLRRCFYPNTAMKLEDNSKIDLKTYLKAAKYYNVTHLIALQNSNLSNSRLTQETTSES